MRPVEKHRGVTIFVSKVEIAGSGFRVRKDDTIQETKPKFETYYHYCGSYPYDSIAECKAAIDKVYENCRCSEELFASIMNNI